jgi:hypothetical protein
MQKSRQNADFFHAVLVAMRGGHSGFRYPSPKTGDVYETLKKIEDYARLSATNAAAQLASNSSSSSVTYDG